MGKPVKFKKGDRIRVTNLPKTWYEVFEVGKIYTVDEVVDSTAYKGKISIRVEEVSGYVLEEHVTFVSKLDKVLN